MDPAGLPPETFSGTISGVQLPDLVQLACLGKMSVRIALAGPSGSGELHVRAGQVVHARAGNAQGEDGFREMMLIAGATFEVNPAGEEEIATIDRGWELLLIEGMRRRTEMTTQAAASSEAFVLSGFFSSITLTDLLQLVCMSRANRLLGIQCAAGSGTIWMREGEACHAEFGDLSGKDAFCEILLQNGGSFESAPPRGDETATIDEPFEFLLMDAMRYRDEKLGVGEEAEESDFETLTQRLQKMKVAEKIRLAITGDKEARTFLMRDSNRMVQIALINNPRLTDGEVAVIAGLRSIEEEVIRKIASTREWQKMYQVRLALATNPRCPFPTAIKMLQTLSTGDLKQISRSKSVSSGVAQAARKMHIEKV